MPYTETQSTASILEKYNIGQPRVSHPSKSPSKSARKPTSHKQAEFAEKKAPIAAEFLQECAFAAVKMTETYLGQEKTYSFVASILKPTIIETTKFGLLVNEAQRKHKQHNGLLIVQDRINKLEHPNNTPTHQIQAACVGSNKTTNVQHRFTIFFEKISDFTEFFPTITDMPETLKKLYDLPNQKPIMEVDNFVSGPDRQPTQNTEPRTSKKRSLQNSESGPSKKIALEERTSQTNSFNTEEKNTENNLGTSACSFFYHEKIPSWRPKIPFVKPPLTNEAKAIPIPSFNFGTLKS